MSREELREAGEALHGERWQTPLAREIPIGDRMMRLMAAGTQPVSERTAGRIDELLDLKAEAVAAVRRKRGRPG
jgi:hypothetical protein